MLNIVIFGGPGSGKGTQSEFIKKKYSLDHISTGDVLRAEIKKGSELGQMCSDIISKGQLIPDDLMIKILAKQFDSFENSNGVIFDGFPRTIAQATALNDILIERGTKVAGVVALEVEEQELIARLIKRGQISGRSDDNEETIAKRLHVYNNQTSPLIEFYKNEGLYKGIEGMGTMEEIFNRICVAIDSL